MTNDAVEDMDDVPSFREMREYSLGSLDVDHRHVHPHAGLIEDDEVRAALSFLADIYDPSQDEIDAGMPRDFWETERAQSAIRRYATDAATKAIQRGDKEVVNYLVGIPSYKSDVSGIHAINQLADWLINAEQCRLIYAAAIMGAGKTDFALTLLEIVHDHFRRVRSTVDEELLAEIPEPRFAANFYAETSPSVGAEIREIHRYSELLEWSSDSGSDDELWFIFDEASTELTAQSGANAQEVAERFAPFVKKMRKRGVNMIVIGHDRGDVHPAIRAVADFVDKTGLKTAEIYEGIKSREPQGHVMSVSGIPETSWEFDTDDVATWEWDAELDDAGMLEAVADEDEEDEDELKEHRNAWVRATYEMSDGLSQSDVGEIFGISQTRVSDIVTKEEITVDDPAQTAEAAGD